VRSAEVLDVGSAMLLPEVLAKPLREGTTDEIAELARLLGRLDLRPADAIIAEMASSLAAAHRLRPADALHLANRGRRRSRPLHHEQPPRLRVGHHRGRGGVPGRRSTNRYEGIVDEPGG
jgi:hypothetical protein